MIGLWWSGSSSPRPTPAFSGSIGIKDGKIAAIGEVTEAATTTLNAAGQTVCPGFVDVHTHYDAQVFWDGTLSTSCYHGVTTVFGGFWHYRYWEDTFKKAGFDLLDSHGQPAVECIKKEVMLYDKYEAVTSFLSTIRVLPKKIFKLLRRMHANAESYIKAEEEELISLNWYTIMQKPQ